MKAPEGWWESAFVRTRNTSEIAGHARGGKEMVIVVAYDITDPKRLKKVADCCKNYGVRVQYSIFECRLEAPQFKSLWNDLSELIDKDDDRIVAYPIHGDACRQIKTLGQMSCSEVVISYIF